MGEFGFFQSVVLGNVLHGRWWEEEEFSFAQIQTHSLFLFSARNEMQFVWLYTPQGPAAGRAWLHPFHGLGNSIHPQHFEVLEDRLGGAPAGWPVLLPVPADVVSRTELLLASHEEGCPGRLWSLLLWRYSRPAWTRSSTANCR